MKKYTIKVSPYARMQLREIREYIVVQLMNPGAAKVLLINMRKQISKLQDMPGRFKTIDVDPWGKQGVRKMIVGNYNVYYWVEESSLIVHVISVAYGKRDQQQVLSRIPNDDFE